MGKACPDGMPEMIAIDDFQITSGRWPRDSRLDNHHHHQPSERVFAGPNAGMRLRLDWLEQWQRRVGEAYQRDVTNDRLWGARLTLGQSQILCSSIPEGTLQTPATLPETLSRPVAGATTDGALRVIGAGAATPPPASAGRWGGAFLPTGKEQRDRQPAITPHDKDQSLAEGVSFEAVVVIPKTEDEKKICVNLCNLWFILKGGLMKKILLMLVVILSTVGLTFSQEPLIGQYSADQVTTAMGRTVQGKIYVDNGKMRVEMEMLGQQVASIVRPDKNLAYVIMPTQKMIMEVPINPENQMLANANSKDAKRELVGTETIKGQLCDKYKITGGNNVVYLWANKGTHIPVQLQSADQKVKVEWNNVKVGPQPASLFEPPAGYRKMSMGSPGATGKNKHRITGIGHVLSHATNDETLGAHASSVPLLDGKTGRQDACAPRGFSREAKRKG
ncbi:MAG: DUF4412 domain-containing protein [Acidobacteria bacterium]|nr:DUF4412 domain-containing protein [Acidobacteriota bacterium]